MQWNRVGNDILGFGGEEEIEEVADLVSQDNHLRSLNFPSLCVFYV